MPNGNGYLQEVQTFLEEGAAVAAAKMVIHKSKGDWDVKSMEILIEELQDELRELQAATSKEELILECGDIINYACMIMHKARRDKQYFSRRIRKPKAEGV